MSETSARTISTSGIPTWTFGDKLRKARDIAGLDQKTFAERIGITSSSLAAYETGRTSPRFDKAPGIAKSIQMLVGIPFEWFLVEDSNGPTPTEGWAPSGSNRRPTDYGGYGPDELSPAVADLDVERTRRRPTMVGVSA